MFGANVGVVNLQVLYHRFHPTCSQGAATFQKLGMSTHPPFLPLLPFL